MIIECPKCGAKNKIPEPVEPGKKYRCGKCKTTLPNNFSAHDKKSPTNHVDAIEQPKETAVMPPKRFQKVVVLLHPFFFAIFPILALYSINVGEVPPREIIMPLIGALAFALLLIVVFRIVGYGITRLRKLQKIRGLFEFSSMQKTAIIASIFLILFFSYGHVLRWMGGWDNMHGTFIVWGPWLVLSVFWSIIFIAAAYYIIKARRNLYGASLIMNVVAIVLVIVASMNVGIRDINSSEHPSITAGSEEAIACGSGKAESLPDIYYIILDRYGSPNNYKENYGFDDSQFVNHLSDLGFYVANETVANYWGTPPSLRSSLNMNYLHKEATDEPITTSISDYPIWHILKSKGYKFIHFGSWSEDTNYNPYADMNINYHSMPAFSELLFQTTWAYPIGVELGIVDPWWKIQYERIKYQFEKLSEIPKMKGPTFVFAHLLVPHPPFVLDSNGNYVTPEQQQKAGESYLDELFQQLIATNKMVTQLVDQLLSSSDVPPIIVIQGDEGERREDLITKDPSWNITKENEKRLQEMMRILNAYYLPGAPQGALYPTISPVNSFRLIFNLYFNCNFKLLPDRSYIGTGGNFIDVTDKVKYGD